MIDYTLILSRKYAGQEWILDGDDYSGLTWLSDTAKPTKTTLDNLWTTVQSEIAAEVEAKATAKAALLERLGITEEEAQLLIGGN
jgi:hypothetical protein